LNSGRKEGSIGPIDAVLFEKEMRVVLHSLFGSPSSSLANNQQQQRGHIYGFKRVQLGLECYSREMDTLTTLLCNKEMRDAPMRQSQSSLDIFKKESKSNLILERYNKF